jgi:Protein of unknown function (DUF1176)
MIAQALLIDPAVAPVEGMPARPPEVISVGTWTGICDNTGSCEAINAAVGRTKPMNLGVLAKLTVSAQGENKQLVVQPLERAGSTRSGVSPRWFIRLRSAPRFGRPAQFPLSVANRQTAQLSDAQTRLLLAEVRRTGAYEAELVAPGSTAGQIFELTGLLAIDEDFSRRSVISKLPRVVALPAQPIPELSLRVMSSRQTRFAEVACGNQLQRARLTITSWPLRGGETLYAASCYYDSGQEVQVWGSGTGDGVILPLDLPAPPRMGNRLAPYLVNAVFDSAKARLSVVQRGRPDGDNLRPDCGASWSWVWTGGGFALETLKVMPVCAGLEEVDWLVAWRSLGTSTTRQ